MTSRVVLDAAAFDELDKGGAAVRSIMRRAAERGIDTWCAAVTLAEVCRGTPRTRRVEASIARDRGGRRIRVVPTDERLAKLVGAILHGADAGSEFLADAHVVAVGAGTDHAVVVTADPDDITRLAAAVPGVRIVTRAP